MAGVAAVRIRLPYYILWWQDLWRYADLPHT